MTHKPVNSLGTGSEGKWELWVETLLLPDNISKRLQHGLIHILQSVFGTQGPHQRCRLVIVMARHSGEQTRETERRHIKQTDRETWKSFLSPLLNKITSAIQTPPWPCTILPLLEVKKNSHQILLSLNFLWALWVAMFGKS